MARFTFLQELIETRTNVFDISAKGAGLCKVTRLDGNQMIALNQWVPHARARNLARNVKPESPGARAVPF